MVKLGDRAKDRVTGFTGIVTAVTVYLNGCVRVQVTPEKLDKDGRPIATESFDVQDLVSVKSAIHAPIEPVVNVPVLAKESKTGGAGRKETTLPSATRG